ncbi:hypothetical protein WN944_025925 [Citrus x changshan-huyou]|uniref:PGG domain-containing protein n=1 Tax=Citrus x changshan-huyou TaxID=2935761 RepID=A0AAP0QDF8_9ROSI
MCPGLLLKANTKGETLLHIAARHGHADIVKDLIAECKKPHQNDPEKGVEAARLMLGTTNEAKDTALHEAVRYNQVDVVKMLTKEPNLPYDANQAGETPLYLAAERGYKDVVVDILSTCISPADHGPMGRTALHAAASLKDTEITKMLLNGKETLTSKPDQQGCLPLHLAAHFGRRYNVKELLKADKSAAYKADNKGKVPLHLAADRGNLDTMQELIFSCPSSCELVDDKGWNVFHFVLNSKSRRAVDLLLKNPSLRNLINEKNDDGNTPLLEHAASGSSYCIRSFFLHPKVDRLAFNHQNNNAEDIFRSGKVVYRLEEIQVPATHGLWRWGKKGSGIGTYSVLRGTAVVPIALVIVDLIICTIIFSLPLLCTEEFSFLEFTDLFPGRALRTINRIEDIAYSALVSPMGMMFIPCYKRILKRTKEDTLVPDTIESAPTKLSLLQLCCMVMLAPAAALSADFFGAVAAAVILLSFSAIPNTVRIEEAMKDEIVNSAID